MARKARLDDDDKAAGTKKRNAIEKTGGKNDRDREEPGPDVYAPPVPAFRIIKPAKTLLLPPLFL